MNKYKIILICMLTSFLVQASMAGTLTKSDIIFSDTLKKELIDYETKFQISEINSKKSRNKPPEPLKESEGRGHSIIEKPGKHGQYTTHNGDGTWKQYRDSGQDHNLISRPNIKETKKNISPDGKVFIGKGKIRKPDLFPLIEEADSTKKVVYLTPKDSLPILEERMANFCRELTPKELKIMESQFEIHSIQWRTTELLTKYDFLFFIYTSL